MTTSAPALLTGRTPPNNPEAEQAVLAALFVRPAALDGVAALLAPESFHSPAHRHVFAAMLALQADARPIDLLTVAERMRAAATLEAAGGTLYLAQLAASAAVTANCVQHAKIVKDCATRRALITIGSHIIEEAFDPARPTAEAARFAPSLDAVAVGAELGNASVTPAQYLDAYLADVTRIQQQGGLAGIATPWEGLNRLTAGLVPGEVTVLAGRSGTGKTAMALNIAEHAARRGHPVGILSLEMTRHGLTNRFMAAGALVDAQRFRNASLREQDWQKLYEYAAIFQTLPLLICDKRELRPSGLRALCRSWKREHGLSLLVLDYLQLMRPETRDAIREREVAEISRSLKLLAVDLEIPILVLAQLNREAEKEKRPRLGHLRESGAIEQDADIILFIIPWRNAHDAPEAVDVELDVAKGRNNAVGTVRLSYLRQFLAFGNRAAPHTQAQARALAPHWQDQTP